MIFLFGEMRKILRCYGEGECYKSKMVLMAQYVSFCMKEIYL